MAFKASDLFRTIGQSDTLLDQAWIERRWGTFVPLWLGASVVMTLLPAFLVCVLMLIPGLLYNAFAAVVHAKTLTISLADLWYLAAGLGVIMGLFTVIFTIPVMLFRHVCGDLQPRPSPSDARP